MSETRHPEAQPSHLSSASSQQPVAQPARSSTGAPRNVLSSDVEIKGSVKFTNDLIVDGKIEGEITSDGNLTVGENARLKAEIKTATVVVYGKVHGNITATSHVELKAGAEIIGDIKALTLTVEAGAIFVGKSIVGTPSEVPTAVPAAIQASGDHSPKSPSPVATPAATGVAKQGNLLSATNP